MIAGDRGPGRVESHGKTQASWISLLKFASFCHGGRMASPSFSMPMMRPNCVTTSQLPAGREYKGQMKTRAMSAASEID
ncbi:MAG: hypothetical protein WDO68_00815 [Gammaproteobacteria bacterium]